MVLFINREEEYILADHVRFISLNKDARGNNASYVTTFGEWERTLATARMHGWEPMGPFWTSSSTANLRYPVARA